MLTIAPALASCDHPASRGTAAVPHAVEVGRHDRAPDVVVNPEGLAADADPRVVHQHVDLAQGFRHRVERRSDALLVGDVERGT